MKWVGFLFHHAPFSLPSFLLQEGVSILFKTSLQDGKLNFLNGKALGLRVCDLGIALNFAKRGNRIIETKELVPEVVISGDFKTFVLLAMRKSDPDTLFFQRKLLVEGDTALGLEIKNFLDSIDPESLPLPFRLAYQLLARMGLIGP